MGDIMGRLKLDLIEIINSINCILQQCHLDRITEVVFGRKHVFEGTELITPMEDEGGGCSFPLGIKLGQSEVGEKA